MAEGNDGTEAEAGGDHQHRNDERRPPDAKAERVQNCVRSVKRERKVKETATTTIVDTETKKEIREKSRTSRVAFKGGGGDMGEEGAVDEEALRRIENPVQRHEHRDDHK
jgi:hypothetical protein